MSSGPARRVRSGSFRASPVGSPRSENEQSLPSPGDPDYGEMTHVLSVPRGRRFSRQQEDASVGASRDALSHLMSPNSGGSSLNPVHRRVKELQQMESAAVGRRRSLSVTAKGRYIRTLLPKIRDHTKMLRDTILNNPEVTSGLSVSVLNTLVSNLSHIEHLLCTELHLFDPAVVIPVQSPEITSSKQGLSLMKRYIFVLPGEIDNLEQLFERSNVDKLSSGSKEIDWKRLEDSTILDEMDALLNANIRLLQQEIIMVPVESLRTLQGMAPAVNVVMSAIRWKRKTKAAGQASADSEEEAPMSMTSTKSMQID